MELLKDIFFYGSGVLLIGLIISFVILLIRINKDIKKMDRKRRNALIDYIRKTSKHRERKRLKF